MATKAHSITRFIALEWEKLYASAVLSGIVGDAAHQRTGGYHISIQDNSISNYSVVRPDDKAPPGTWPRDLAAAIDMSMNPSDMALCSSRLWNVWNDKTDPRRVYLNGFNGWFNDGGPAKRYDFVTQGISTTTSDHKWHVHKEIRRKWVTSMIAAMAILSILKGESKQQYIQSLSGGDDMFCKYGDGNSVPGGDPKVTAMQLQLLDVNPGALPKYGADGGYGDETAAAVSRELTGGEGKVYGAKEFAVLQRRIAEKFGPAGGGTLPDTINVTGEMSGTMTGNVSGTVTGTLQINK